MEMSKLLEQVEAVLAEATEIESFADIAKKQSWVKKVIKTGSGVDVFLDAKDRLYVEFDNGQYVWEDFSWSVPLGKDAKTAVANMKKGMDLMDKDKEAFKKKYGRKK